MAGWLKRWTMRADHSASETLIEHAAPFAEMPVPERPAGEDYHAWRWAMCHFEDVPHADVNAAQRPGQGRFSDLGV